MSSKPIYLDYAATTPLDPRVAERMRTVLQNAFANPASNHIMGRRAAAEVAEAETQVRELLCAGGGSIIWTSGATESNNLAILGVAEQRAHRGRHLVTMRTEHKAVVDVFKALEKRGFEVTWLNGDTEGRLSADELADAIRDDTQLVSVIHVNNETGCIQDLAKLGAVCRARGITFHSDGAQAAGKISVDLGSLPVDLYSLTAHKFYGPKGIGALYVADGTHLEPQLFGGGQQRRLRPGTMPVDLIAGMGETAAVAKERMADDLEALAALKAQLLGGIREIDGVYVNGPEQSAYPGILNVGADGVEGESLLLALEPICVATGSACNSQSKEPSYVLKALGRSDLEAQSAIRFSLGRPTTAEDITFTVEHYAAAINKLRELAPEETR